MKRAAVVLLAACTGQIQPFKPEPLPELVAPQMAPHVLVVTELAVIPGESLVWEVRAHGMAIGKVEYGVGEREMRSKFATDGLAGAMVSIQHELVTATASGGVQAVASDETLVMDGETKHFATTFDGARAMVNDEPIAIPAGNNGQTLHTALATLRAWAQPGAPSGFVYVIVAGKLYRLDVMQPIVAELKGRKTLRVDGKIAGEPMAFTLWLSVDPARVPLRVDVTADDAHVTAELIQ